jgi:hypothetical protein
VVGGSGADTGGGDSRNGHEHTVSATGSVRAPHHGLQTASVPKKPELNAADMFFAVLGHKNRLDDFGF